MAEETGQEPTTTDGQEPPADDANQGTAPGQMTPEQLNAELKRARSEAAKYRTERNHLQTKVSEFEQSHLSELEKTQRRVADLEAAESAWQQERQHLLVSSAVTTAAQSAGAIRPDAVYKLLDLADVEFADDGRPSNLDKVIAKVRGEYPELFRNPAGSGDGGPRGSAAHKVDMNDWLRGKVEMRP